MVNQPYNSPPVPMNKYDLIKLMPRGRAGPQQAAAAAGRNGPQQAAATGRNGPQQAAAATGRNGPQQAAAATGRNGPQQAVTGRNGPQQAAAATGRNGPQQAAAAATGRNGPQQAAAAATGRNGPQQAVTGQAAPPAPTTTKVPSVPTAKDASVPTAKAPPAPTTTKASSVPTAKVPSVPTAKDASVPTAKAPRIPTAKASSAPTAKAPIIPTAKAPSVPTAKAPLIPTAKAPLIPTAKAPQINGISAKRIRSLSDGDPSTSTQPIFAKVKKFKKNSPLPHSGHPKKVVKKRSPSTSRGNKAKRPKPDDDTSVEDPPEVETQVIPDWLLAKAGWYLAQVIKYELARRGNDVHGEIRTMLMEFVENYEETNCLEVNVPLDSMDFEEPRHDELKTILEPLFVPAADYKYTFKEKQARIQRLDKSLLRTNDDEMRTVPLVMTSCAHTNLLTAEGAYIVELAQQYLVTKLNEVFDSESAMRIRKGNTPNGYLKDKRQQFFSRKGFPSLPKPPMPAAPQPVKVFTVENGFDEEKLTNLVKASSICVVRGLKEATGMNPSVFSFEAVVAILGEKHKLEVLRQLPQHSTRNLKTTHQTKEPKEMMFQRWEMESLKQNVDLGAFIKNYGDLQEVVKKELDKLSSNLDKKDEFLKGLLQELVKNQLPLYPTQKRKVQGDFPLISFGTNLDLDCLKKFSAQYDELRKLPAMFYVDSELMKHTKSTLKGFTRVQIYYKHPGARTSAHIENQGFDSINYNLGPGNCTWYSVPLEFAAMMEQLACKHQAYPYHTGFWPNEDELRRAGIPVIKFEQKPGDLVYVGTGSYHWVQSNGYTANIAWNVGQETFEQVAAAALIYDHNAEQSYMTLVPVEAMMWDIARNKKYINTELYKVVKPILARSLFCAQTVDDFVTSKNLVIKSMSKAPAEAEMQAVERCSSSKCNHSSLFNVVMLAKQEDNYMKYCIECAPLSDDPSANPVCYRRYMMKTLLKTFKNYSRPV